MKFLLSALVSLCFSFYLDAQKLSTRSGYVRFFSEAPVENIEAINQQSSSIFNLENGQFAFLVPIKGFVFEKALMQEHFNENYMESGEYPTATFKGKVLDFANLDLAKEGQQEITLAGTLSMHGVERQVQIPVQWTNEEGLKRIAGEFTLKASDYGVEIPASKKDNINNSLLIEVRYDY